MQQQTDFSLRSEAHKNVSGVVGVRLALEKLPGRGCGDPASYERAYGRKGQDAADDGSGITLAEAISYAEQL